MFKIINGLFDTKYNNNKQNIKNDTIINLDEVRNNNLKKALSKNNQIKESARDKVVSNKQKEEVFPNSVKLDGSTLENALEKSGDAYYKAFSEWKGTIVNLFNGFKAIKTFATTKIFKKNQTKSIDAKSNINSKTIDNKVSKSINVNLYKDTKTNRLYNKRLISVNKNGCIRLCSIRPLKLDNSNSKITDKINKVQSNRKASSYKEFNKVQKTILKTNGTSENKNLKPISTTNKYFDSKITDKINKDDIKIKKSSIKTQKKLTKAIKKSSNGNVFSKFLPGITSMLSGSIGKILKFGKILLKTTTSIALLSKLLPGFGSTSETQIIPKNNKSTTKKIKTTKTTTSLWEKTKNIFNKKDVVSAKDTTKLSEKSTAKIGEKSLLKIGGKSLLKKIPGLGVLAGLGFAGSRAMGGDFKGAGLEALSGFLSMIPIFGTAGSIAVDGYLAKRDYNKNFTSSNNTNSAIKNDVITEKTYNEINRSDKQITKVNNKNTSLGNTNNKNIVHNSESNTKETNNKDIVQPIIIDNKEIVNAIQLQTNMIVKSLSSNNKDNNIIKNDILKQNNNVIYQPSRQYRGDSL